MKPAQVPYSVEKADQEAKCRAIDVLHSCVRAKGHDGPHSCGDCVHGWTSEAIDTKRPATSDNDLCWAKRETNYIELEEAS